MSTTDLLSEAWQLEFEALQLEAARAAETAKRVAWDAAAQQMATAADAATRADAARDQAEKAEQERDAKKKGDKGELHHAETLAAAANVAKSTAMADAATQAADEAQKWAAAGRVATLAAVEWEKLVAAATAADDTRVAEFAERCARVDSGQAVAAEDKKVKADADARRFATSPNATQVGAARVESAPAAPEEHDPFVRRAAVSAIGLSVFAFVIGLSVIASLGTAIPTEVLVFGNTLAGALLGVLIPSPTQANAAPAAHDSMPRSGWAWADEVWKNRVVLTLLAIFLISAAWASVNKDATQVVALAGAAGGAVLGILVPSPKSK